MTTHSKFANSTYIHFGNTWADPPKPLLDIKSPLIHLNPFRTMTTTDPPKPLQDYIAINPHWSTHTYRAISHFDPPEPTLAPTDPPQPLLYYNHNRSPSTPSSITTTTTDPLKGSVVLTQQLSGAQQVRSITVLEDAQYQTRELPSWEGQIRQLETWHTSLIKPPATDTSLLRLQQHNWIENFFSCRYQI